MTGFYLYCVGSSDHPEPVALTGIEDVPVRALETAGLRVWVSTMEGPPAASLERVRAHNAVVEAAAAERTPLPMRFGQWFASEAELATAMEERRERLERALDRVRGALEFGVRVLDPGPVNAPPQDRSSGTAYLEGLARREEVADRSRRRGAEVAAELRSFLGPLVRADAVRPGGAGALVTIAHLVARHDTGTYGTRLRTFSERRPGVRLVSSGPWPPYGFADDGA